MANKIQFKRGSGTPASSILSVGEPGFDTANNKFYIGDSTGKPILINEEAEVYAADESVEVSTEVIDAGTLGGHPASDFRSNTWLPTPTEIGAVPSGYGYGESLIGLGSTSDDAAFTAKLSEQFANTANKTRQFYFTHGGGAFLGTLWNAGNNYGVLVATSYAEPGVAYRFKQMVRVCTNGTWGDWVDFSPASFAGAPKSFSIPYGQAVTLTFPNGTQNALIVCRSTLNGGYAVFNYSGYGVGGSQRSNVDRLCGTEKYTYGILPQSENTNGMVIWNRNNSGNGSCRVFPILGSYPTITSGDGGATEVPFNENYVKMDLLWENASPTASFAAQTLTLDLSDYDSILCVGKVSTGTLRDVPPAMAKVGGTDAMITAPISGKSYRRILNATTSGVTFNAGESFSSYASATMGSDNTCLIPNRIYGIKGVS